MTVYNGLMYVKLYFLNRPENREYLFSVTFFKQKLLQILFSTTYTNGIFWKFRFGFPLDQKNSHIYRIFSAINLPVAHQDLILELRDLPQKLCTTILSTK